MLRLRLVEGLTLREVGERTGVTDGRVQQLLRDYFGLRVRKPEGVAPAGESEVRVPPGFVEVLREIVECGYGAGIVTALREWQDLECQIASWSGDAKQNHVARRNIRRIKAFMLSAGVDDRSVVSVALPAEAVALVRLGLLGELGETAWEISEAIGRAGYDEAAEWYAEPLKRQDAVRALLNAMGWENVEEPRPVMVYLDVHRDALVRAHAQQPRRPADARHGPRYAGGAARDGRGELRAAGEAARGDRRPGATAGQRWGLDAPEVSGIFDSCGQLEPALTMA